MNQEKRHRVCPAELAGMLDSRLRRRLQSPERILSPFVKAGDRALDFGCGPGFFTIPLAELVGERGEVIAADLQQAMLDIVALKLSGTPLAVRVKLHLSAPDRTGISEPLDFVLAFHVLHELPDQRAFLAEVVTLMNKGARLLIAEPWFHVGRADFLVLRKILSGLELDLIATPRIFWSRALVLRRRKNS